MANSVVALPIRPPPRRRNGAKLVVFLLQARRSDPERVDLSLPGLTERKTIALGRNRPPIGRLQQDIAADLARMIIDEFHLDIEGAALLPRHDDALRRIDVDDERRGYAEFPQDVAEGQVRLARTDRLADPNGLAHHLVRRHGHQAGRPGRQVQIGRIAHLVLVFSDRMAIEIPLG